MPNKREEGQGLSFELRLDQVCNRFEAAWRTGEPRIEDFLDGWSGAERLRLLRELVLLDLHYRRQRGEQCQPGDYCQRFPEAAASWFESFLAAGSTDDGKPVTPGVAPTIAFLAVGQQVSEHEILEEIGRGGMGVVYRARHRQLGRIVALKMIRAGSAAEADELARFQSEARAIAQLSHPNIVAVHEVGEHDGLPFFSMEFCPGGGLDRYLGGTPVAPAEATRLVRTLATAMQAAHELRVVHRDLKPANVLLCPARPTESGEGGRAAAVGVHGQGERLRPGQAAGRSLSDAIGCPGGHTGIHVPRASRGQKRRSAPPRISIPWERSSMSASPAGLPSKRRRLWTPSSRSPSRNPSRLANSNQPRPSTWKPSA